MIESARLVQIDLPAAGRQEVIQFTPTQGNDANRKMEVLLASFDLDSRNPAGMPKIVIQELNELRKGNEYLNGMNYVVKVYSRRQGEHQWYDHKNSQTDLDPR